MKVWLEKKDQTTYVVMHVSRPAHIGGIIVSPLEIPVIGALGVAGGRVGDVPTLLLQQRGGGTPVPDALGPFSVGLISGVKSETGRELEQSSIGDGVLGQIAVLVRPNLPAHTTVATARVPTGVLSIEYTLCEGNPGWLAILFGKVEFCGSNGGQAPEDLIVIPEVLAVIGGEEVVLALLEIHSFLDNIVEL